MLADRGLFLKSATGRTISPVIKQHIRTSTIGWITKIIYCVNAIIRADRGQESRLPSCLPATYVGRVAGPAWGTSDGRGVRHSPESSRSAPRAVSFAAGTVSIVRPKPAVQPFRRGGTGATQWYRPTASDGEMTDRDGVW